MRVKLLWSNVCLLSVQEQKHLADAAARLKGAGIELVAEYYGLGKEDLSERVRRSGFDADIMVSTDLDVYEDRALYDTFRDSLLSIRDMLPVKEAFISGPLFRNPLLLPILFVPLVMVVNRAAWGGAPLPRSLRELRDVPKAFGGRNNSAGKGLEKQLRGLYGDKFSEDFLEASEIFEMPVQAFRAAQTGSVAAALVPTIFAMRADGDELVRIYPEEGAATVPCFAAARNSITPETAKTALKTIFTYEFNSFYASNGHVQPCLANAEDAEIVRENGYKFLYTP
jgi:hypothetical protein